MLTYNQLCKKKRKNKKDKNKRIALGGSPQRKGICVRVYVTNPKKPNSAARKVARVLLSTRYTVTASIPGEKHNLQKHGEVLVRGGRVRDIPGVRYKIIRGKYDLKEVPRRMRGRSKYGTRKWKKAIKIKIKKQN